MTRPPTSRGASHSAARADELLQLRARLDRLEADQKVVLHLALTGYEGAPWLRFATVLAEYGCAVLRAWIATGRIFHESAKRGRPVRRRITTLDDDDIAELANETVAKAIRAFRLKVLIPSRWNAAKGASLRTFFVGQCRFQFRDVYEAWERERCVPPPSLVLADLQPLSSIPISGEASAELVEWVDRTSLQSPQFIVAADHLGYSYAEIARMLGTTVSGVQSRMYRFRKRCA